jgi:GntR family hexuronate regulon transcriptional repressor
MAGPSVAGRKLYQKVVNALMEDIAGGKIAVGDKLPPERELAERFDVSRPTVREAVLALELQGVVESRHGSGVYVLFGRGESGAQHDLDIGAFELTEARALFEGEAAALAASTIAQDELDALEETLAQMVVENESQAVGEQADRRFHLGIAQATHNTAIATVVEMLWDMRYRSPLCRHMLDKARGGGIKPRIDDHRRLLDALQARDAAAARRAMRDHLERVMDALLKVTETDILERAQSEITATRDKYARRRSV